VSSFCVRSTAGNSSNPRDYRVRVDPQASTVFELISTIDPAQRIAAQIHFDDLFTPSSEQLAPSSWSTRDKEGVASCAPLQLNAQIRVELAAVDLSAVTAGDYQALFQLRAGGNGQDSDIFQVTVTISEAVWIQNLDPISLSYTLGSDAIGDEPFCVWSSTGFYDVTISSLTSTGAPTFVATGQTVPANTVNFGVLFDDDADASDGAAVTEGVTITNQTTPASGSPASCLTDNSAIRVTFPETANLDAAPADAYADELTILVEPR
jgi:hypothetical protein